MKCALIIATGIKQIMLTPESEEEKSALKLIAPDQEISVDIKQGTFYDNSPPSAQGYIVQESKGGHLRGYEDIDSIMLVLRPKKKNEKPKQS